VIVKDDKTDYSFDIGVIEHVAYPRDLHFHRMVEFKRVLGEKLIASYKVSLSDPNHSTFLKNFGKFHVAGLSESTVPAEKYLIEMMGDLQNEISQLKSIVQRESGERPNAPEKLIPGAVRIGLEIEKYLNENPSVDLASKKQDKDFMREILESCDAVTHFNTYDQFYSTFQNVLSDAISRQRRFKRGGKE
jgi:hypothetical protein